MVALEVAKKAAIMNHGVPVSEELLAIVIVHTVICTRAWFL